MQQRAGHVATLLELKTMAEQSKRNSGSKTLVSAIGDHLNVVSSFLQFSKANETKIFYGAEVTDKKARETILVLEKLRKAKQFLPESEF